MATEKKGSSAIVRRAASTTPANVIEFTDEQKALIKSQIAPDATNDELAIFLHQCTRTGLDPLTRQIYCIHRFSGGKKKMTIQTSIDGFRVVAERSGVYAGQAEPEFFYNDNKALECCKIRVYKFSPAGERYEAAVGVAFWKEYALTTGLWPSKPHIMLSKVAEALALRKAFPQDLSGLYTEDEIPANDNPPAMSITVTKEDAKRPPNATPIDRRAETTVDGEVISTETVPAAPVNTIAWAYTESMQALLLTELKLSKFAEDKALNDLIKQENGRIMTEATYKKISANLADPANQQKQKTPAELKADTKPATYGLEPGQM